MAFLGVLGLASGVDGAQGAREVVVLPTTGIVDSVMAGYLREGIARAARDGAGAVVVQLNTPGGSLDATNDIVGTLLGAEIPVIVWVAPSGGRAASAGTFITLAGHIALMAPGTNIGAASPVGGSGEDIPGTLGDKVRNDAIAKIRSIAEERDRSVAWAESTVAEAVSASANEAVRVDAVDGIAATLEEVVAFADGRTVELRSGEVTLDLDAAASRELPMNPFQAFLHLLSDPNIAATLFSVGSLGLVYELISPNFVTGILGALAIILAFIGFGSLPLNVGGLLLIGLAMLLFALEVTVVSHGLLAVGGIVCFALGASALYTEPGTPTAPDVSVAFPLVLALTLSVAAFMALSTFTVLRTRRRIALAGPVDRIDGIAPGTPAEVHNPLDPVGSVFVAGEEWTARSSDGSTVERGTPVRVTRADGLTVIVEPVAAEPGVGSRPARVRRRGAG